MHTIAETAAPNLGKAQFKVTQTQRCSASCGRFENRHYCVAQQYHDFIFLFFTNRYALLQTYKAIVCAHSGHVPLTLSHVCIVLDALAAFSSCVTFPWQLCPQDFLIMFLHHVATISLITFSYVNNMARVGTLVMCLHDAADVLIEVRMGERIKCCGWTDERMEAKTVGRVGLEFAQLFIFI